MMKPVAAPAKSKQEQNLENASLASHNEAMIQANADLLKAQPVGNISGVPAPAPPAAGPGASIVANRDGKAYRVSVPMGARQDVIEAACDALTDKVMPKDPCGCGNDGKPPAVKKEE